jgi:hypothetical protein
MARLADEWDEQRQVCIDVLCPYLPMPYETNVASEKYREGEREVRLTIIRLIHDHLQDPDDPTAWCGHDLDFTNATFDGGDFSGAKFTGGGVSFHGAKFISAGGSLSLTRNSLWVRSPSTARNSPVARSASVRLNSPAALFSSTR